MRFNVGSLLDLMGAATLADEGDRLAFYGSADRSRPPVIVLVVTPDGHFAARDAALETPMESPHDELAESLLFFRRRLTQKIIVAMIQSAGPIANGVSSVYENPAAHAEDLANAICERLAARETGDPKGYGR